MPIIDADAHVVESELTWQYMDESDSNYKPFIVTSNTDGKRFWVIDGRIFFRGSNVNRNLPAKSREMQSVEARLKHMDELGLDFQVLYPSIFLLIFLL